MVHLLFDLHTHSSASDGQYTPSQLIQIASKKNIKYLAITDHDTVSGLNEASEAAKSTNVNFIPGIEISIQYPTGEFHLLGLGIKKVSPSMTQLLQELQQNRQTRNMQIFERIKEFFPDTSWEEISADFPNTSLGRPHFARYLVKKGYVKSTQEAFDLHLGRGKNCYVSRENADLDTGISAIKDSGGIPVIAHPMSLYLSWGRLPDALQEIYEHGVQGLEAFHPGARNTDCFRLDEVARKIGFFITAASDFHGEKLKPDRKIGHTCGNKKIDNNLIPDIENVLLTLTK